MMFSPRRDEQAALAFADLASALDAGLPLEQLGGDPRLGDQVLLDLCWRRGITLDPTERIVLEAGWLSGHAAKTLAERAKARTARAEFKRQMRASLAYPVTLLAMLLAAALATMSVIGPTFAITLGSLYLLAAVVAGLLWSRWRRGAAELEHLPVIGRLVRDVRELPYLESLHALYAAGVPIVRAHGMALRGVRLRGLRERLGIAHALLEQGRSLREALAESASLGAETRSLLATGEQAGQLEDALQRALVRRQQQAARTLTGAAKTVGRVTYALAAIGVLVIAVSFYRSYFALLLGR
ncbi:MAG TPA: hypothetical protein ENI87_07140 [bacterium]|nr:hypothetical protein [bacterium]